MNECDCKYCQAGEYMNAFNDLEYTVNRNFEVIEEFFENHEDEIAGIDQDRSKLYRVIFPEFLRLLHNYTASIYANIDKAQTIRAKIDDKKFTEAYQDKIEEMNLTPRSKLLIKIRNYYQHQDTPRIQYIQSFSEKEGYDAFLALDRDSLLDNLELGENAKAYLKGKEENIDIRKELRKFQGSIEEFNSWFRSFKASETNRLRQK